ncbi:MAG: hypothetical protein HYR66_17880 [Sphingobacteriales bacterium]|nr:hypothetical protein [Sphingobacteriales bacterium]MBI3720070.1 hypothetical protein [Sphingobacteriales bacterium]
MNNKKGVVTAVLHKLKKPHPSGRCELLCFPMGYYRNIILPMDLASGGENFFLFYKIVLDKLLDFDVSG